MSLLIDKLVFCIYCVVWLTLPSSGQVGSCKDVNSILSKIPCEGMDDEQTRSVSRMKEIVSTIVTRRAKMSTTRHREAVESVC